MEFCNKGMVQADPLPPSYGQRPYFDHFIFWDPSLMSVLLYYLDKGHIDFVYIWPFFSVHFNIDEIAIHDFGHFFTFKALPLHHMAPVI